MTDATTPPYFPDTGFDEEYPRLNTELHPIVPPRLRVGALNWYTAAWLEPAATPDAKDREENPDTTNAARASEIDWTLLEICKKIINNPAITEKKINGVEKITGIDLFGVRLLAHRIDKKDELRNLKANEDNRYRQEIFTVSFKYRSVYYKLHISLHQEYITTNFQAELVDVPERARNRAKRYLDGLSKDGKFNETTVAYLYQEFWDEAKEFLGLQSTKEFGLSKFADFRGIVVTKAAPDDASQPPHSPRPGERYSAAEAVRLTRSMMRFMEAAAKPSDHPEFCAATFLDRRAIYMSSLGARPTESTGGTVDAPTHDGRPVRYLILSRAGARAETRNRWQIGRLLDRLNTLGTYRLAALRDLKHFNAASIAVRELGGKLQALSDEDHSVPPDDRALQEQHAGLYRELNLIGKECKGGFAFRIERSRFYATSLQRLVPDLRSHRIEGFQPYDEFVRRRLASTYDFIDRLGVRVERARTRLDSLNGELRTSQQVEQTREQTRLLRFAEIVTVVPVAHYGTEIARALPYKPSHEWWVPLDIALAYMVCIWVFKPLANFLYSLIEAKHEHAIKITQHQIYKKNSPRPADVKDVPDLKTTWQDRRRYRTQQEIAAHPLALVLWGVLILTILILGGLQYPQWTNKGEPAKAISATVSIFPPPPPPTAAASLPPRPAASHRPKAHHPALNGPPHRPK